MQSEAVLFGAAAGASAIVLVVLAAAVVATCHAVHRRRLQRRAGRLAGEDLATCRAIAALPVARRNSLEP